MTRALVTVAAVGALVVGAAACSNPSSDIGLTISIGYSNVADGGVALNDNALLYSPGGPFTVDLTATLTNTPSTDAATGPLHGTVMIDTGFAAPGATMTGAVTLLPRAGGIYHGSIALAWPPGGIIPVLALVDGISQRAQIAIDQPQLQLDFLFPPQVGAAAVIPMCVSSDAASGTVAVHVEHTTFVGATTGDLSIALVPGECGAAFTGITAPPWTIQSHALLTAVNPGVAFEASAVLDNALATNPPIGTPTVITIPAAALAPVEVHITSPATGTHESIGGAVTLAIRVLYDQPSGPALPAAGVTVMLSSSPSVPIVPVPAVTNAAGVATASFAMPAAASGSVIISAAVGGVTDSITLIAP